MLHECCTQSADADRRTFSKCENVLCRFFFVSNKGALVAYVANSPLSLSRKIGVVACLILKIHTTFRVVASFLKSRHMHK
jgi:hypothetical protein